MPVTDEEIRELLHQRSSLAPLNPDRVSQVQAGIRRSRQRRNVGSAAAAVLVLAAAVGGVSMVRSDTSGTGERSNPVAPPVRPPMSGVPKLFTDRDGVKYRRLSLVKLGPDKRQTTISVPTSGKPLAFDGECKTRPGKDKSGFDIQPITTPPTEGGVTVGCERGRISAGPDHSIAVYGKESPKAKFTFKAAPGVRLKFGIYEWSAPRPDGRQVPEPSLPDEIKVARDGGKARTYYMVEAESAPWPVRKTSTHTMSQRPAGKYVVAGLCAGPLADRDLLAELSVRGTLIGEIPCVSKGPGNPPMVGPIDHATQLSSPDQPKPVSIQMKLIPSTSDYLKLPGSWHFGLYADKKPVR